MNHGKNLLVAGIAGGFINRVFQFLYTLTENIGGIGITAGVSISVTGILYMRRDLTARSPMAE